MEGRSADEPMRTEGLFQEEAVSGDEGKGAAIVDGEASGLMLLFPSLSPGGVEGRAFARRSARVERACSRRRMCLEVCESVPCRFAFLLEGL